MNVYRVVEVVVIVKVYFVSFHNHFQIKNHIAGNVSSQNFPRFEIKCFF